MKKKLKERSNSVKLTDSGVLVDAKIISIQRGYESIQEYITEAVMEKNERENKKPNAKA